MNPDSLNVLRLKLAIVNLPLRCTRYISTGLLDKLLKLNCAGLLLSATKLLDAFNCNVPILVPNGPPSAKFPVNVFAYPGAPEPT